MIHQKIRTQQWKTIWDRNGTAWKAPTRRLDMERMNARAVRKPRMTRGWVRTEVFRFAIADVLRRCAGLIDGGRGVR